MTPKHLVTIAFFCLLIGLPVGLFLNARAQKPSTKPQDDKKPASTNYRISGPYTHKNLTVFLVHGKDLLPGRNFLTLQEALPKRKSGFTKQKTSMSSPSETSRTRTSTSRPATSCAAANKIE